VKLPTATHTSSSTPEERSEITSLSQAESIDRGSRSVPLDFGGGVRRVETFPPVDAEEAGAAGSVAAGEEALSGPVGFHPVSDAAPGVLLLETAAAGGVAGADSLSVLGSEGVGLSLGGEAEALGLVEGDGEGDDQTVRGDIMEPSLLCDR
jgi:hypothetical protein